MSKKQLQNIWENLWFQAKIFFKSHDLSIGIQFSLLVLPLLLSIASFYLGGVKLFDYLSFTFSILALAYYWYFWKNSELYMSWWEKYLTIYKKTENLYRSTKKISKEDVKWLNIMEESLCLDKNKPATHPFAKIWVDLTIEKEMKYWNEKVVWWKK